jgi:ankyrin repeat protein
VRSTYDYARFLLTRLYVDSLLDKDTKKRVRFALEKLPKGSEALDQAYGEAIERIEGQLPGKRARAKSVLSWITYALRPLTTGELCHALAVEGDMELGQDNIPDIEDVVSVCAGLVTVDEESNIIHLVHYTTHEYFERIRDDWNPSAQQEIASACLNYLSLDIFRSGSCPSDKDFESRVEQYIFLDYAALYWGRHVLRVQEEVSSLAFRFFQDSNLVSCAVQVMSISKAGSGQSPGYSEHFPTQTTGLHLTAEFGLLHLLEKLLHESGRDIIISADWKDGYGQTPLARAAANGHEAVVKLLLDNGGVDPDSKDYYGQTPLARAAANGHEGAVKLLLDKEGVDPNSKDEDSQTPLWRAAEGGHEEVVKLLLDKEGVDPDPKDDYDQTPLWWAAVKGHEGVVKLLLNKEGVDPNSKDYHSQTPLWRAAEDGHEGVVKLLLDKEGVDPNSKNEDGQTPLCRAAEGGHEGVVKLLLDKEGIDPDFKDSDGRTPLSWAAENGHKGVVKLLLDKEGVDPDSKDSDGRTPLSRAAENKHEGVVQLLLGKAVDVESKHEAGWEEDSDSLSDLSEVSSVQSSLPSLVSDSSLASMRDKYGSKAAEHLADLLSEDSVLASMYEAAIAKFGRERFHKNHDQLLKAFFKDLRSETQNSVQLATVRGLRSRDRRHEITLLIHNAFEPLNVHKQQAMTILRDQKANRKQLLDHYLEERTSVLQVDSITSFGGDLEHRNVEPLEQDDESVDEGVNSNSSSDNNDRPLHQDDKETYAYLQPLEIFITRGDAFARFKTNFGYLLRPPTNLSEALKSHDLHIVQRFLVRNFASAATSDYEWLHELDEAGYSKREIAELLLEDISDSPWIHFTPQAHVRHRIKTIFHVPGCAHQTSFNIKPQSLLYSEQVHSRSPLHTDVRRQVEELCGIGGVVPSSRDASTWHGSVTFEEQSSVSMITYAAASAVARQSRNDLVVRISNVLTNFCTAAAAVQSTGLCCDSFTVLLRIQNCLELRRVELHNAMKMAFYINLALQDDSTEAAVQRCIQMAEHILQELRVTIPETTPNADLHYCALAAQFLCAAFLSYIQAHVGSVDPFFLDTPQRKMVLLGSQRVPGDFAINAELVELTCLAEMTQQLVLAFSSGATSRELRLEGGTSRYDVLTNAEDCLDTWGPGYFIHNKANPSKIHAVAIGGGFVSLADSKTSRFHWAKGTLPESASRAAFEPYTIMRIGAAVSINEKCCIDEAASRESSFCALEPLGTHEVFWEPQERQAGFQGGQYLTGTYSQTWKKIPGTTLKQRNLQQSDGRLIHFLEQSWGLQVSFCTSVARRVSLRELVTDLLPMFVNPLEQDTWQELVNGHNIIQAFTQGNLFAWLRTLSSSLQFYVLTLVRKILEQLQHTGLDRRNTTLVIAWPQEGDIERGLRIPCKAQTCWAQVIADAEDCATFAYVTPKCLETNHVKCRGSQRAWQNASKMLVTEMSPSRPEGQPVVAITTIPAPVTTTTATATTQWELEDKKTYYIKKLDSLLRVKVERPSSASNDVAHLVVARSNIPQGLWKRLLVREEERRNNRIRERQAMGDRAECVVVRAGLIGA